jgi:hypothetical protein
VSSGSAPYLGGTLFAQGRAVTSGCATGVSNTIPSPPTFNTTTGVARFSVGLAVTSCPGAANTTQAFHFIRDGVGNLTFRVPANGSYNISTNWSVKGDLEYNISSSGPPPTRWSQSVVLWMGQGVCVLDLTSAGPLICNYWTRAPVSFPNGTGKFSFNWTRNTMFDRWHLLTGHHYVLASFVRAEMEAYTNGGIPGGSVSMKLDLHSAGSFGATLNRYTIRG